MVHDCDPDVVIRDCLCRSFVNHQFREVEPTGLLGGRRRGDCCLARDPMCLTTVETFQLNYELVYQIAARDPIVSYVTLP